MKIGELIRRLEKIKSGLSKTAQGNDVDVEITVRDGSQGLRLLGRSAVTRVDVEGNNDKGDEATRIIIASVEPE